MVTCSADGTAALWHVGGDGATTTRLRQYKQSSVVNAVAASTRHDFVTVSDDGLIRRYDARHARTVASWPGGAAKTVPVVALAVTPDSGGHGVVFTGGVDPTIFAWDQRHTAAPLYTLEQAHTDTITSLALNPATPSSSSASQLLSHGLDRTLRIWNVQPLALGGQRHVKSLMGHATHPHSPALHCAWNATGTLVSAGSSDALVHVWDVESGGRPVYSLPGHRGTVHAVAFDPQHAHIVASGGSDEQVFVGELS
jgi:Prp8 binding protein